MSDKLTDLEICKRIAEIEGEQVTIRYEWDKNLITRLSYGGEFNDRMPEYNPLTDDALCFKLMIKYNVSFWQNEDKGMFCAKVRDPEFGVVRVKKPNLAICLAIIESKVKSND
jgi:hypothetical protein